MVQEFASTPEEKRVLVVGRDDKRPTNNDPDSHDTRVASMPRRE